MKASARRSGPILPHEVLVRKGANTGYRRRRLGPEPSRADSVFAPSHRVSKSPPADHTPFCKSRITYSWPGGSLFAKTSSPLLLPLEGSLDRGILSDRKTALGGDISGNGTVEDEIARTIEISLNLNVAG